MDLTLKCVHAFEASGFHFFVVGLFVGFHLGPMGFKEGRRVGLGFKVGRRVGVGFKGDRWVWTSK